jgi:hypothetical protein
VFHVELRQFPNQTRMFNLGREELEARILKPWVSGTAVDVDDRRWAPDRARLTVYEGPRLEADQLGMGRGWGNVTRQGEDVTARVLTQARASVARPAPVLAFKYEIVARCAAGALPLAQVVELAGESYPQARVSEQVALAERAVWELLHEGAVQLRRRGEAVVAEDWQEALLSWEAWRADAVTVARV